MSNVFSDEYRKGIDPIVTANHRAGRPVWSRCRKCNAIVALGHCNTAAATCPACRVA